MPPEFLFHSKRKLFWRKNGRLFAPFVHCDKKIFIFSLGTEQILKWKKTLPADPLYLVTTCQCLGAHLEQRHSLPPCSLLTVWHRSSHAGSEDPVVLAPSHPAEEPKSCW